MSYTTITAHVKDQTLQLANLNRIASGSKGVIRIQIDFCELWDGYGKAAVFYKEERNVYHIPVVDGLVEVPHEVLKDSGYFFFGVMGSADNTRTTEVLKVTVVQGAITSATATPAEPTPDIYQQLLALCEDTRIIAKQAYACFGGAASNIKAMEGTLLQEPYTDELLEYDHFVAIKSSRSAPFFVYSRDTERVWAKSVGLNAVGPQNEQYTMLPELLDLVFNKDPETGAWALESSQTLATGRFPCTWDKVIGYKYIYHTGNEEDPVDGDRPAYAVLYEAQELTDEQKAQARKNIGAAANGESEQGLPVMAAPDPYPVLCFEDLVEGEGYNMMNGKVTTSPNAKRSRGLVPCTEGVLFVTDLPANVSVTLFRYDAEFNFLGLGYPAQAGGNNFSATGEGTCYISLMITNADAIDSVTLKAINPDGLSVIEWPFDGKDKNYLYRDGYYAKNFNSYVGLTVSADWACVVLPVRGIRQIHTNLIHENQCAFVDGSNKPVTFAAEESNDFESKDPENPGPPPGRTITVPDGAQLVYLNIYKPAYHYGDPGHTAQYFALWTDEVLAQPLAGKRILCIGDSITYLDGKYGNGDGSPFVGWQAELRKRGALVDTFAWSGAILSHVEGGTVIYNHIEYSVDTGRLRVADYDTIVIFAGTNDVFLKTNLDDFAANTVNTINLLRGYNATAQIYLANIMPACNDANRDLASIEAYNNKLTQTAEGLGVPVFDLYNEVGVNGYTFGHFYYDTVHPNSRGMKRVGRIIAEKLGAYIAGKGNIRVQDADTFTAEEMAQIAAAAADSVRAKTETFYDSPLSFGVSNDADLTAIVTALPANASCVFWINDNTFPEVFAEIAEQSLKLGIPAPYGIVEVKKHHNVATATWDSYENTATLVNRWSDTNGVGWAGWKMHLLTEPAAVINASEVAM